MRKGFTLLELVIVMVVMLTLAVVGFTSYTNSINRSDDAKRKSDIKLIQNALELYKNANGRYPITTGWVNSASSADGTSGTYWIPDLDQTYIKTMPSDPKNILANPPGAPDQTGNYLYGYYSADGLCSSPSLPTGLTGGSYYILAAKLENTSDPDAGQPTTVISGCPWPGGSGTNVYAVSNP